MKYCSGGNSFSVGALCGCRECQGGDEKAAASRRHFWRLARVAAVLRSIRLVAKLVKDVCPWQVIVTHENKGVLISC